MVIAEVTVVSLGVGYEIGYAEARGTKVICLYQIGAPGRLSSMISGNKNVLVIMYSDLEDLKQKLVPLLVK
jgi:nucleoside 2-deoxyribosyltransferase